MHKTDIAYIAGLFDADGCISIEKTRTSGHRCSPRYRIRADIQMSDDIAIRFVGRALGREPKLMALASMNHKDRIPRMNAYRLQWHTAQAATVLRLLLPYLRGKKKQALLCLRFYDTISSRTHRKKLTERQLDASESLYQRVKELKRPIALRC